MTTISTHEKSIQSGYGLVFSTSVILITATDRMSGFVLITNLPTTNASGSFFLRWKFLEILKLINNVQLVVTTRKRLSWLVNRGTFGSISRKKVTLKSGGAPCKVWILPKIEAHLHRTCRSRPTRELVGPIQRPVWVTLQCRNTPQWKYFPILQEHHQQYPYTRAPPHHQSNHLKVRPRLLLQVNLPFKPQIQ